jgi:hypothetical protein
LFFKSGVGNNRKQARMRARLSAVFILLAGVLLFSAPVVAAETTALRIEVEDPDGEPVPRASVIVRTLKGKKGNKVRDSFELKTSNEGSAPLPPIRRGRVLIQVIAKGYQTYGDTVILSEDEQTVSVKLSPPQEQFSVHKP